MSFRILTSAFLLLFLSFSSPRADVLFDGVNDYLQMVGAQLSGLVSASTGSASIWAKGIGTAQSTGAACWRAEAYVSDSGGFWGVFRRIFGAPDDFCAYSYDGTEDEAFSAYATGWHHLAFVHTGGNILLYVDGALTATTASGNTQTLTGAFQIGVGNLPQYLHGVVAEVEVFSTALSAQEIAFLAGSRTHWVASSAPSGSWDLQACGEGADCTSISFPDRSGNAHVVRNPTATEGGTGQSSDFISYPWGVD